MRSANGWRHLRASTGELWIEPGEAALRPLIEAAIAADRARYGSLVRREASGAWRTTTGARVTLDWTTLSLAQRGRDTAAIDFAYRVHYLQWTGVESVDRGLGIAGISGVALLAALGLRIAFRGGNAAPRRAPAPRR